jgi:glycosyltransferase involved in cell wall biosynthesis
VTHPLLAGRLVFAGPPHPPTSPQQLFDRLQQASARVLQRGGTTEAALSDYAQMLQKVRELEFAEWMADLSQWPAIVNLPSLAKFYGGRVFEGIAAGRPMISWDVPDHPRNRALFEDGKDMLLFPPDDPGALARHIDRVLRDREFAESLVQNARQKLMRHHTAERRLHHTLRWLETGAQPDYVPAYSAPR